MRRSSRFLVVAATSLVFANACGGGHSDPSASVHVTASASAASSLVGPEGLVVDIPAAASDVDVTIVVTVPSGRRPAPAGTVSVGTALKLTPEGQTFSKPLEITIPIEPSSIPSGHTIDDVVVVRAPQGSDSTAFVPLPTRRSGNAVIAQTEHFSDFIPVIITDTANSPFGACGDDVCVPTESCDACPADCGLCLPGDSTPPTVAMLESPMQLTQVRGDASVVVAFDEALMPASVSSATVSVSTGGTPIGGTLSLSGSKITFVPNQLLASTTYDVRVTGVRDLAGNLLAADYTSQFTTAAAFTLVDVYPPSGTTNVSLGDTINFQLSDMVDYALLDIQDEDGPCTGTVQASADGFVTCLGAAFNEGGPNDIPIMRFNRSWPGSATIAIRFTSTVVDANGFSVGGIIGPYTFSTVPDTYGPYINGTTPYDGESDVALTSEWVTEFDDPIVLSAPGTTIELRQDGSLVPGSLSLQGRFLHFTPTVPFGPNLHYTWFVSMAQDAAGNVMEASATGSFDTARTPYVATSSPSNGGVGVHPRQDIVLAFSEPIASASLTMQAIDGPCTGSVQIQNGTSCYGGVLVTTPTSTTTATLQATTSLPLGAHIDIVVQPSAVSDKGIGFVGGPAMGFRVSPVNGFAYAMRSSIDTTGALGGISGADSFCDGQYPGSKAFLITPARYPCTTADCVGTGPAMDWVLSAATTYVNAAGDELFTTDALQPIFTAWPMANAYSARMWNFQFGGTVNWTPSGLDCNGFTDGTNTSSVSVGYEFSSTAGFINGGMLGCDSTRPVLCVDPVPGVLPTTH